MKALTALLVCHRITSRAIQAEKFDKFPLGSVVFVTHSRYKGHGIVSNYLTNVDLLAVRLENANVWHYEIDTVEPDPERKHWPPWIKREMRRRKAKHA
jgi:hypothetical protein